MLRFDNHHPYLVFGRRGLEGRAMSLPSAKSLAARLSRAPLRRWRKEEPENCFLQYHSDSDYSILVDFTGMTDEEAELSWKRGGRRPNDKSL